jgi:DNA-binding NarL/FixJ family response regulator
LILLDIGLPILSGTDAASQIRKLVPSVKILFVTQNNDSDVVRAALSDGAHGYVLKAAAGRDLVPAIEAVSMGRGL